MSMCTGGNFKDESLNAQNSRPKKKTGELTKRMDLTDAMKTPPVKYVKLQIKCL